MDSSHASRILKGKKWKHVAMLVLAFALVGATTAPAQAKTRDSEHPLHDYLYATAPYPALEEAIIDCESGWDPDAWNPSGAAGLAQFMPRTWRWGGELFGIYGSPYDPYASIDMLNAFADAGMLGHWSCYWIVTEGWNPD